MSHRSLALLACLALFLAACRKAPPVEVTGSSPSPGPGAGAAADPAHPEPAAAAAVATEAEVTALLGELTQQVRKFGFEKQRVPGSLDELVTAGYLTAQPVPPAGKKFSIDPKTLQVVLK